MKRIFLTWLFLNNVLSAASEEPARGCSNAGFYAKADFLWWSAQNHGFSYAFNRTNRVVYEGKILRLPSDWKPGFRVMAGWNTEYYSWDILLNWTWYLNHTTQTSQRNGPNIGSLDGFYPLFPLDTGGNIPYRTVEARWRLLYDTGDFEIGRAFYPVPGVSFRPQWGIRGAWLDQLFSDFFSNEVNVSNIEAAELQFKGKNSYWGIGPRAGCSAGWDLSHGFSLVGNIAAALLYGSSEVSFLTNTALFIGGPLDRYQKYTDEFAQLVPTLQTMLGFRWGTCFSSDKRYFGVDVSWEGNYWWNQFNIPIAQTYVSGSLIEPNYPFPTLGNQPVTMEGLTVDLHLNF